jgi:hypothetical protein
MAPDRAFRGTPGLPGRGTLELGMGFVLFWSAIAYLIVGPWGLVVAIPLGLACLGTFRRA